MSAFEFWSAPPTQLLFPVVSRTTSPSSLSLWSTPIYINYFSHVSNSFILSAWVTLYIWKNKKEMLWNTDMKASSVTAVQTVFSWDEMVIIIKRGLEWEFKLIDDIYVLRLSTPWKVLIINEIQSVTIIFILSIGIKD